MKREQQIFVREEESETKVMTMGEPLDKTNYDTTLFFSFLSSAPAVSGNGKNQYNLGVVCTKG